MLAGRLGVSRTTLDRAFAADIGASPAYMLARMRLNEAKRLMKNTELSISEVAYRLGYCNPAYFTNVFRREIGKTPKAWRAHRELSR